MFEKGAGRRKKAYFLSSIKIKFEKVFMGDKSTLFLRILVCLPVTCSSKAYSRKYCEWPSWSSAPLSIIPYRTPRNWLPFSSM